MGDLHDAKIRITLNVQTGNDEIIRLPKKVYPALMQIKFGL
jgi:hypothetical protein